MTEDNTTPRDFLPALSAPYLVNSPFYSYIRSSDFKRLLSQTSSLVDTNQVKTLAILSAYPQEGRTFFVSALALGYAILLKRRVLIVNTSLRVRKDSLNIEKIYFEELQHAPGMRDGQPVRAIDLMSPKMSTNDVSQADTVDFQIGRYISVYKNNYDLILIDNCAITIHDEKTIDPIVIAGQADASLLVTSDKSLKRGPLVEMKELLSKWRVRVIGTIHNENNGGWKKS
jgi:Mrp family chromosome partitioning ATPase